MAKLTEEVRAKVQDLYRENLVVLGDVNAIEKTLSRIKNEATELVEKLDTLLDDENGSNKT